MSTKRIRTTPNLEVDRHKDKQTTGRADVDSPPNDVAALRRRMLEGRLGWRWPLILCFIRSPLFIGGFFVLLMIIMLSGRHNAAVFAEGLTVYDLPVPVDLCCLFLLAHIVHREGIRIRDIVHVSKDYLLRDLLIGTALFCGIYVLAFLLVAGILVLVAGPTFFTAQTAQLLLATTGLNPLGLPWHIIVSVLILPITTSVVEELIYRGYVQPRLQVLSGSSWIALLVMALGFALQHIAFGLISWPLALAGFITTFVVGLIFGWINLLTRQRLLSLMLIHWQANVISLGLVPLLLTLLLK